MVPAALVFLIAVNVPGILLMLKSLLLVLSYHVEVLPALSVSNVSGVPSFANVPAVGIPAVACVAVAPMVPLLKASYQRLLTVYCKLYVHISNFYFEKLRLH